ncbi:hypothetical protein I5M32_07435 [Pedobacter sp. SD-b]|uniref:Lipocalin-like domain-containing protein n=1 Tax=Pedobacter segetis TaxID=2793069 RepID=A0ABS1BIS6_9SPHI|nr:hypothetical protein [Pedobacter segetis]MBK0382789.1 hypothetical protein [Pedobacter segetis]
MKSKLLIIFFLTVSVLSIQSCKKDNSNAQISLTGRWDATNATIEVFENNVSKQKLNQTASIGDFYLIFEGNNVQLYTNSQLEEEGSYTYDQTSKVLTIKYGVNDSETLQLSKVTTTSFSLIQEDSVTNGTVTTKTVSEVAFKKQ